ncbi:DNA-binding protein [Chromohalobacter israelensis]|uniref:DNA-binding protein n=1 Tax=Chromohalobacter israelensis TaxID=141390 RepID=UPI003D7B01BB
MKYEIRIIEGKPIWHAPGSPMSRSPPPPPPTPWLGQAREPSIQRIREQLGTGSPNTIHRHLTVWRAAQAPARASGRTVAGRVGQRIGR